MALPQGQWIFESVPLYDPDSWVRERFFTERFDRKPFDVICLRMPWGSVRYLRVPSRNPSNPTYQFLPPDQRVPPKEGRRVFDWRESKTVFIPARRGGKRLAAANRQGA